MDEEHLRRRASFNSNASLYNAARPDYPAAVFDDLVELSGIPASGDILEIGSGTGKATLPLAERGFSILAIELGDNMAALARQKLAAYPRVRINVGAFEDWPVPEQAFDLAVSASAWHWIDPAVGYAKVAHALRLGGALALMWSTQGRRGNLLQPPNETAVPAPSDEFSEALQQLVATLVPQLANLRADRPTPSGARRFVRGEALLASGYFAAPTIRTYSWETTYDTAGYLQLLDSYSTYRILDPALHARLFDAIGDMLEMRFGGKISRQWRAELYIAKVVSPLP
jgi:SAM-dependent methyltransferase